MIDLAANTVVTGLRLNDNQLTSIDLSANTALQDLILNGNPDVPCSDFEEIETQFPDLEFEYACIP